MSTTGGEAIHDLPGYDSDTGESGEDDDDDEDMDDLMEGEEFADELSEAERRANEEDMRDVEEETARLQREASLLDGGVHQGQGAREGGANGAKSAGGEAGSAVSAVEGEGEQARGAGGAGRGSALGSDGEAGLPDRAHWLDSEGAEERAARRDCVAINKSLVRDLEKLTRKIEKRRDECRERLKAACTNLKDIKDSRWGLGGLDGSRKGSAMHGKRKTAFWEEPPPCAGKEDAGKIQELGREHRTQTWREEERRHLCRIVAEQVRQRLFNTAQDDFIDDTRAYNDAIAELKEMPLVADGGQEGLLKRADRSEWCEQQAFWDDVARYHLRGRTAADCYAQWVAAGDPRLSSAEWGSSHEDAKLLRLVDSLFKQRSPAPPFPPCSPAGAAGAPLTPPGEAGGAGGRGRGRRSQRSSGRGGRRATFSKGSNACWTRARCETGRGPRRRTRASSGPTRRCGGGRAAGTGAGPRRAGWRWRGRCSRRGSCAATSSASTGGPRWTRGGRAR